ncbi:hypothetical protein HDU93_002196 [Gonapodya sp. JEL0774]|nr:hypothetical protein HDU93_002196 [Gonapodya sp. JEL0774]
MVPRSLGDLDKIRNPVRPRPMRMVHLDHAPGQLGRRNFLTASLFDVHPKPVSVVSKRVDIAGKTWYKIKWAGGSESEHALDSLPTSVVTPNGLLHAFEHRTPYAPVLRFPTLLQAYAKARTAAQTKIMSLKENSTIGDKKDARLYRPNAKESREWDDRVQLWTHDMSSESEEDDDDDDYSGNPPPGGTLLGDVTVRPSGLRLATELTTGAPVYEGEGANGSDPSNDGEVELSIDADGDLNMSGIQERTGGWADDTHIPMSPANFQPPTPSGPESQQPGSGHAVSDPSHVRKLTRNIVPAPVPARRQGSSVFAGITDLKATWSGVENSKSPAPERTNVSPEVLLAQAQASGFGDNDEDESGLQAEESADGQLTRLRAEGGYDVPPLGSRGRQAVFEGETAFGTWGGDAEEDGIDQDGEGGMDPDIPEDPLEELRRDAEADEEFDREAGDVSENELEGLLEEARAVSPIGVDLDGAFGGRGGRRRRARGGGDPEDRISEEILPAVTDTAPIEESIDSRLSALPPSASMLHAPAPSLHEPSSDETRLIFDEESSSPAQVTYSSIMVPSTAISHPSPAVPKKRSPRPGLCRVRRITSDSDNSESDLDSGDDIVVLLPARPGAASAVASDRVPGTLGGGFKAASSSLKLGVRDVGNSDEEADKDSVYVNDSATDTDNVDELMTDESDDSGPRLPGRNRKRKRKAKGKGRSIHKQKARAETDGGVQTLFHYSVSWE